MFARNLIRRQVGLVAKQHQHQQLFHKSAVNKLTIPFLSTLPQNAGGVKGDVNSNLTPPKSDKMHGGIHWDFEKILSIGLVPLCGASLASGGDISGVADTLLSGILLAHVWVGFQSCIIDYIPARVYGKNHNYAMYLLSLGSLVSVYGIYELETKENGLIGVVKKLWGTPGQDSEIKEEKK
ncbi:hypothetical protein ACO0RG_002614 [Hanseniaspora osmophila]|uniref:Succinate dehydrogenase [ubiquinone] cytochrome b small subunit n=1 Tax=Hanseniaspora osmophila TaxID=56408 RepID=A0A1E5R7L1_9ASCO|nr:Succinate dehydrogenase [ubiquinone] cytochrome b small subunit, mitochondrial [Hanseniaspora osmophila]